MRSWVGLLCAWLAFAAPATAILVETSRPERYEQPPPDDPGWRNIGRRGITSAIYLGGGWVLTARHSSMGPVEFDGKNYLPVEESMHWVSSPSGAYKSDLLMFRITPEPDLPAITLRRRPIRAGQDIVIVGFGQGRGAPALAGSGFRLDGRGIKRWGSNRVEGGQRHIRGPNQTLTRCFSMNFRSGASHHEAQATVGDSGGAVFVRGPKRWQLGGVMLSVGSNLRQPKDEVHFGNVTHAADIAVYAPEITAVLEGRYRAPAAPPVADKLP